MCSTKWRPISASIDCGGSGGGSGVARVFANKVQLSVTVMRKHKTAISITCPAAAHLSKERWRCQSVWQSSLNVSDIDALEHMYISLSEAYPASDWQLSFGTEAQPT